MYLLLALEEELKKHSQNITSTLLLHSHQFNKRNSAKAAIYILSEIIVLFYVHSLTLDKKNNIYDEKILIHC